MFDMMKFPSQQDEPWDFKKKVQPQKETEAKKVTTRINHENQQWLTENKDNFRKIEKIKVEDAQVFVQKLDEKTIKNIAKSCDCANPTSGQHQPQQQLLDDPDHQYKLPVQWNPKLQSAYRDNYQVKDIKDTNELMYQLEQNNQHFKGQYKAQHPFGGFYYEESKKDEQESVTSEEEEEEEQEVDDGQPKKMTTKFMKSAKVLDPTNPDDAAKLERRKQRIKKFQGETRWIADTAFTTYFGKPAWGPYGYNNINPAVGGIVYGQHMLSHNVQPHRNSNDPFYIQTYQNALRKGAGVSSLEPEPPRNCREEDRLNPDQVESLKQRNQLTPQPFADLKKKLVDSKGKPMIADLSIKKPDLTNTLRFASEAGSVQGEQSVQEQSQNNKKLKKKNQPRPQSAADNRSEQNKSQKNGKGEDKQSKISNDHKTKDSKRKQEKKVQIQSESKLNQQLDDSLAIPDKANNKFIEEMKQKKEKANRLTCKVNEINPSLLKSSPKQEQKNIITSDLQEVRSFDDKNPPPNYLQQLDPIELNPKNYKGVPSDWLHRIPFAGKKQEIIKNGKQTKDCFDYGY